LASKEQEAAKAALICTEPYEQALAEREFALQTNFVEANGAAIQGRMKDLDREMKLLIR
jgi:hypothetical protein